MLKNLLVTCGLNETEQAVFVHLVERGSSTASAIATQLRLKRPTVYATLDSLLRIGILSKQKKEKVTYFFPVSIGMIPKIFEERARSSFEEVSQATKLMEPHLQQLKRANQDETSRFENVTFESVEAVYAQLESTLLGGDFCSFFNPQMVTNDKFITKYLNHTAKTKPHIREIAVAGPRTDWYKSLIKNPNHLVKEIPAESQLYSDMILIKGSVIMIDYDPKNEVAIKIKHQNHYLSMMKIFDLLWERL